MRGNDNTRTFSKKLGGGFIKKMAINQIRFEMIFLLGILIGKEGDGIW